MSAPQVGRSARPSASAKAAARAFSVTTCRAIGSSATCSIVASRSAFTPIRSAAASHAARRCAYALVSSRRSSPLWITKISTVGGDADDASERIGPHVRPSVGTRAEGDTYFTVDRDREAEARLVVGVVADEVDPAGSSHDQHRARVRKARRASRMRAPRLYPWP